MSQAYREGGRVTIGDREFVVPKAALADAKAVTDVQAKLAKGQIGDGYLAAAEALRILLVKASPGLTVEELLDLVDVEGLKETVAQVQAGGGIGLLPAAGGVSFPWWPHGTEHPPGSRRVQEVRPGGSIEPVEPGWDRLYGRIITVTGWRWEWVDEMLLEQVDALARYWEECPPVHEVAAAMAGYKPPPSAERSAGPARKAGITDEERQMVERWSRALGPP